MCVTCVNTIFLCMYLLYSVCVHVCVPTYVCVCVYVCVPTCVCVCVCVCVQRVCTYLHRVLQIKGILQNRTQIEEWIEDKAIRRHQQHHRHEERSDSEEESSSGEEEQETTKEKVANKKKKNDVKLFIYPNDLGWKRNLCSSSEWVVCI